MPQTGNIERHKALPGNPFVKRKTEATEQLRVWNEIDDKGWEVRGIVHSHTHTEAYPSETDVRQAFLPDAWYVLVSLLDRERPAIRGFSIRDGDVLEREVVIR